MLLVLETDLQKFSAPEFRQEILQRTMYSGEQNITQFLKPDTMLALKTHLASRGISLEHMLKLKPGMLSITLTVVELQKLALDPWMDRFPKLYNSLLVERNNNWIPQIERMLETKEVEFVLFGALQCIHTDPQTLFFFRW